MCAACGGTHYLNIGIAFYYPRKPRRTPAATAEPILLVLNYLILVLSLLLVLLLFFLLFLSFESGVSFESGGLLSKYMKFLR